MTIGLDRYAVTSPYDPLAAAEADVTDLSTLDDRAFDEDSIDGDDFLDELLELETASDPSFAEGLADIAHRQEIVRFLIDRRRSSGVSQRVVAEAMGTTQSAVSDIEAGSGDLYLSTLQRYARAVGGCLELGVHFPAGGRRSMAPTVARVYSLGWRRDSSDTGYAAAVHPFRRVG